MADEIVLFRQINVALLCYLYFRLFSNIINIVLIKISGLGAIGKRCFVICSRLRAGNNGGRCFVYLKCNLIYTYLASWWQFYVVFYVCKYSNSLLKAYRSNIDIVIQSIVY